MYYSNKKRFLAISEYANVLETFRLCFRYINNVFTSYFASDYACKYL